MKRLSILLFVLPMIMASCSNDESNGVEYVPYQETDDGRWSMISPSGKVLFEEEFKNALQQ